jgi:D-alanyl-D-alanine dipeptidase
MRSNEYNRNSAPFGLSLKLFDGYRPQRAVAHFVRWAQNLNDQRMKAEFYPDVDKRDLFKDGYIAEKSGHSRGSTVDLTLISLDTSDPVAKLVLLCQIYLFDLQLYI